MKSVAIYLVCALCPFIRSIGHEVYLSPLKNKVAKKRKSRPIRSIRGADLVKKRREYGNLVLEFCTICIKKSRLIYSNLVPNLIEIGFFESISITVIFLIIIGDLRCT